jgi:hypothetical protein
MTCMYDGIERVEGDRRFSQEYVGPTHVTLLRDKDKSLPSMDVRAISHRMVVLGGSNIHNLTVSTRY